MKIFDYLYYKIYKATLTGSVKDIAGFAASIYFAGLIFVNLFVIGAFLRKIDSLPFFFSEKKQVITFIIFLFVGCYFLFLYNKRYKKIIAKYEQESDEERRKGNLVVRLYVIVSFLLFITLAFYKPGKF